MTTLGRATVLLLAAFALIAAGCGGSDDGADEAVATAAAVAVDDAQVAAGLARMATVAAETAAKAAIDAAAGKTAAEGLELNWAPIEDVVKANEPDTYIEIEDAMAQLGSGDATKAAAGAVRMATAVTGYVAKHPG